MKLYLVILALAVSLLSTGCGTSGPTAPPPTTYTIGGTVTGLSGTGLVLQDNGGNNLPVSASGAFTFTTAIASGSSYKVTVLTQPSSPVQNCGVTNGSGTATGNVTNVSIACTTTTYTIGGTITGLTGTGLVLQDNAGDNLTVGANETSFTFATALDSGAAYKVTVLTQPSSPTQNCVVTGGTGTATGNVTNVSIACTTLTYTVSGTVSGLVGTGLVLQDNGGNNLSVTANGPFAFTAGVGEGLGYSVSVFAEPTSPVQSCVVTNGSGTSSVNVTNVVVTCTTTLYAISGTVSGLTGAGLVLQDNGGDNLTVLASSPSFAFATKLDSIQTYAVTVLTPPINPPQNCAVTSGGTGTANASVDVVVTCSNISTWTFVDGPDVDDQFGVYGTMGTPATTNVPGARYFGVSWSDTSGNFWLFGGEGYDSVGNTADLNDLWEGNPNSSPWAWTWVGGDNMVAQGGTYNTKGTANPANIPGARDSAVSWTDPSGNFWLFGGHGYDVNRTADNLNDLWEYSNTGATKGQWTWVSGSDTVDQAGSYGTKGMGTTSTVPGARYNAVSWIDKNGIFWLYGGMGLDSNGTVGYLNDLWEGSYNSSNEWIWTWVSGSAVGGVKGAYGIEGTGNANTFPGARYLSTSWTDTSGNLWLFGGFGPDSVGNIAVLSDLWEYNTTTGIWTWVGGSEIAAVEGVYGTLGTAAAANIPGSRKGSVGWTDSLGNFWLFGGVGIDSADTSGQLNDLWQYNPTSGQWTWESGADTANQSGCYAVLLPACPATYPGSRGGSPNWIDSSGDLWLFGGNGPLSGFNGSFSDLWKYVP